MPPPHELEKIGVELAVACTLAIIGWRAGRSPQRDRRVRRLAVYAQVVVALLAAAFLLAPAYMQWRGGPDGAPYTGLLVLLVPILLTLAAVALILVSCAAALTETWMARRDRWFAVLVVDSAIPVGLALFLFAINLSHVDPNSSLALGSFLLCLLSIPAVAVYAFVGAGVKGPDAVAVSAGQEGEPD